MEGDAALEGKEGEDAPPSEGGLGTEADEEEEEEEQAETEADEVTARPAITAEETPPARDDSLFITGESWLNNAAVSEPAASAFETEEESEGEDMPLAPQMAPTATEDATGTTAGTRDELWSFEAALDDVRFPALPVIAAWWLQLAGLLERSLFPISEPSSRPALSFSFSFSLSSSSYLPARVSILTLSRVTGSVRSREVSGSAPREGEEGRAGMV